MTTAPRNRHHHPAFTLTELLIVIGIIAVLMGLLFPLIGKIKRSAYIADTQNEISQISNACNAYYSTYQAYPGPFSNYETQMGGAPIGSADNGTFPEGGAATNPTLAYTYTIVSGTPTWTKISSSTPYCVTGAQNLVMGLMGGLRLAAASTNAVAPFNIAFAPSEVGLGPMSLNALNPARQQPFFANGSTYLMWCEQPGMSGTGMVYQATTYNPADTPVPFTDAALNQAADAPMPVFVDRFPQPGPLPILYLRARVGGQGIISDGTTVHSPVTPGVAPQYQYDIRDIIPYTNPASNGSAVATSGCTVQAVGLQTGFIHDLSAVYATSGTNNATIPPITISSVVKAGIALPASGPNASPTTTAYQDGFPYFANRSISSTNANDINYGGRPRAVDQFILISAGPDGIYGTADDITSFGDVSQ